MDGQSILKRVEEKYLSIQSYSDEGTVETFYEHPFDCQQLIEFKTYFVRPEKMRFEWRCWDQYFGKTRPPSENAIWTNGKNSFETFIGESEPVDKFSLALAEASGVSFGSVLMILKLLVPGCVGTRSIWYQMNDAVVLPAADVDGSLCYHLSGSEDSHNDTEAWIRQNDLVVLRLRSKNELTQELAEKAFIETCDELKKNEVSEDKWPTKPIGTVKYSHDYFYKEIKVDEPILDETFETLP
jgi:hypothetical protein